MADTQKQKEWEAELFRLLVENVKDYAIFILDTQGRVLSWSTGAERLMGYREEEILGEPYSRFFLPAEITSGEPQREMDQAALTGRGEDDRWHIRKDGTIFWCSGVMTPLKDGGGELRGFAKIMRDLTEQKLYEEYRREAEERFHFLVDAVRDYAIFMLDTAGRVVSWNTGAERIKGYTLDEIAGQHFSRFYTPEDREKGRPEKNLEDATRGGRTEDVGWRVRKDGSLFMAEVVIYALRSDAGELRGFAKVTRDVTERKRWEEQLIQRERELAELNAHKDQFIAVLSHELRNPLAPIRNVVEILRQRIFDDPALQRVLSMLERQVRVLTRLVDELLDVARITTGRVEIRRELVEARVVLERAAEMARPGIEARKHQLRVTVPQEPIWLDGDPIRLEQVVVNLLDNAAKYTAPGGSIWLTAAREGPEVTIRARDTGQGIEPETLTRIFELFWRADPAYDRVESGMGVGLALARKILAMHGGTIEAHSAGCGQGSEFIIRLPAATRRTQQVPELAAEAQAHSLRLLVVDDNPDAAESLAILLRMHGHDVRVAHSGRAALEAVREQQPQVILLDLGMPEMDGFEVARRLRQELGPGGVVLVAVTGYGQESDRQRSREAGFAFHLTKPADPTQLQYLLQALASRTGGSF